MPPSRSISRIACASFSASAAIPAPFGDRATASSKKGVERIIRAPIWRRLSADVQVRQRFLELPRAGICDLCFAEAQDFQILEVPQLPQSGIRDVGLAEVETRQVLEPLELPQAGVRDLGVLEVERHQIVEPFELFQAGVCEVRRSKVEQT